MSDATWLGRAGFGLFFHLLPDTRERLTEVTETFDAEGFAGDCDAAGASYVFLTLGQNSGFINAPNAAYDRWAGPGRTAGRDLPLDVADSLGRRGIRFLLYTSGLAPADDREAARSLGCVAKSDDITKDWIITDAFANRWSEVLTEFSRRYGSKVSGWWVDGCYQWAGFSNKIAEVYSRALKSGNPDAIVTFNPGAEVLARTNPWDDYTAGEFDNLLAPRCGGPLVDGIQWHELSYLCMHWGSGPIRVTRCEFERHRTGILAHGGALTVDVPLESTGLRIRADVLDFLHGTGK